MVKEVLRSAEKFSEPLPLSPLPLDPSAILLTAEILSGLSLVSQKSLVIAVAMRPCTQVHNNLLSCHLPQCGNATAMVSLSGLGNQLSCPKQGFPKWVVPIDRDRLFWVTDREGFTLLMKLIGACTFLVTV